MTHLPPPLSKTSKPTVLIIEDNADQWFVIRWALLQRFSEVDSVWFADPTQAVIYLENCLEYSLDLPQLILQDLYLPTYQVGLETLRLLRKPDKLYREIPLIILSQFVDKDTIKASYDGGANSVIAKPLTYSAWLDCFATFRDYWWNKVDLPDLAHWYRNPPNSSLNHQTDQA